MSTERADVLKEIITNRRSIRRFKPDPVPREVILALIDAARLAPSASNRQPWRFFVAASESSKEVLRSSGTVLQDFVLKAPVCLVCGADMTAYSDKETRAAIDELIQSGGMPSASDPEEIAGYWAWWNRVSHGKDLMKLAYLDVGIAVEHIALMAVAAGLGACWMRRINEDDIGKALGLPPNIVVVALMAIGYPDEDPKPRPRKNLETFLLNPHGF